MHLTPAERAAAGEQGDVPAALLASSALATQSRDARLALASERNVRRLSELPLPVVAVAGGEGGGCSAQASARALLPPGAVAAAQWLGGGVGVGAPPAAPSLPASAPAPPPAPPAPPAPSTSASAAWQPPPPALPAGGATWPPIRFGLEIKNVWSTDMTPTSEADPRSCSTERVCALGSAWSLDAKRFIGPAAGAEGGDTLPGQEYLAVYLRRRPVGEIGRAHV